MAHRSTLLLALPFRAASLGTGPCTPGDIVLPGLSAPVTVVTDRHGVRHLTAQDDFDLAFAQGYVHARDRFFQMDVLRRQISGDLAELLGPGEIGDDIAARTVGLRRAAERSLAVLPARLVAVLQAYADGVNAYLASQPLPPEYDLLELSAARPWDVVDVLTLGKGLAANLSLDIDIGNSIELGNYIAAGLAGGFDGEALFFEDVRRLAPIDPAATLPDAGGAPPFDSAALSPAGAAGLASAQGARRAVALLEQNPIFAAAMRRREFSIGSNEWGVGAENAAGGRPIIANDPHLALTAPATFYEWHLVVPNDPETGPLNVSGVGFPGTPGVVLGQNERVAWGATTNGLDVSDVYEDEFVLLLPECTSLGALACIRSEGVLHPVEIQLNVVYEYNVIGDGMLDHLVPAPLPFEQTIIATVPFRSYGPVLDISGISLPNPGVGTALVLQFTGFHATRELETFFKWNRAADIDDFVDGLDDFDFGAQNWAYADADGNLAYFSSGEAPLRADLEAGPIDRKQAPVFIRDGSGPQNWVPDPAHSQGQSIPYAVLPDDERARLVNPPFFVNANNDTTGVSLDNDPLDERRSSNPDAVYYLAPGYSNGLRAGRITRLIEQRLDQGQKISAIDMKRFQANTQELDAEILVPFLLDAFDAAAAPGAAPELAALAADPELDEAVGRLADWDFSTPPGIEEGYDASDPYGVRRGVSEGEARASVAATIYNLWRAKAIRGVVDATLGSEGLAAGSGDALKALVHLLRQDPFTGVGASGLDFFPEPAALSAPERRDLALLEALREALDALASDTFAPAFAHSTEQDDYRWGRLHRIVFEHEFEPSFSVPPAGGFASLAPDLPGLSRDGGYEVVNASGFSARADGLDSFMFGSGPVRRYVGVGGLWAVGGAGWVRGYNVIPGGPSGDPDSPLYTTQLGSWLTADYHAVRMDDHVPAPIQREVLVPGP
jgi:penicillin amidase